MSVPNVGQPFYPQGMIVRDAGGNNYQSDGRGNLIPVTIAPAMTPGNPAQPQIQNSLPQPQQQQIPQQQQQQPQTLQPGQITDSTIMQGPGVPAYMQGRTWGQVKAMTEEYVRRQQQGNGNAQPASQAQQQPNGQQPQQPQQQQQQSQGVPTDPRAFYTNPAENTRRLIQEELAPLRDMLRPMLQNTAQSAAERARDEFLRQNPGAAAVMGEMGPMLQNLAPEQLANPQTWDAVYNYALGQRVRQIESQRAVGYNPQPQPQGQSPMPVRSTPAGDFFTESPSPSPRQLDNTQMPAQLQPWQHAIAHASGMTDQQYIDAQTAIRNGQMPQFGMQPTGAPR
jgi:hypothetical protein